MTHPEQSPGDMPTPEHEPDLANHHAQALYEYLGTPQDDLTGYQADAMIVPGNAFWSSAQLAAQLYHEQKAPLIIMSGGAKRNSSWVTEGERARKHAELAPPVAELVQESASLDLRNSQGEPADYRWVGDRPPNEADQFAWRAADLKVPESAILREPIASNTAENYHFSLKRLKSYCQEHGHPYPPQRVIIVSYAPEARRNFLTAQKEFGQLGIDFRIVSPPRPFAEEFRADLDPTARRKKIMDLVASVQRIYLYGEKGKGDISGGATLPKEVHVAFEALRQLGFRPEVEAKFAQLKKDFDRYVGSDYSLQGVFVNDEPSQ